jgi:hypothetical protein
MIFLEHLDAHTAISRLPQAFQKGTGQLMPASGRAIIGIDEDVGIQEL